MRPTLSIALAGLALASSARGAPQLPVPSQTRPHPWSMRHADAARTGQSPARGAQTGDVAWKFQIAGRTHSFAVAREGSIYVGTVFRNESWSNETYTYALSADGRRKWRAKVKPYTWGFSQGLASSPALDSTGQVIVPSTFSQVLSFSPVGELDWTFQRNSGSTNDSSPAVRADGSIVHHQGAEGLASLRPDGSLEWLTAGIFSTSSSVAIAPNGDLAIGGVKSNEPHGFPALYYLNADGTIRWVFETIFGSGNTPVFGPDGTVYCCAFPLGITAFAPDGTILWNHGFGDGTPALGADGVLHVAGTGAIRAYDASTGALSWSVVAPGPNLDGLAIDSTGHVYVTTTNGYLAAYGPGGTTLFEKQLCDEFETGPVIGTGGLVVAGGVEQFTRFVYGIE